VLAVGATLAIGKPRDVVDAEIAVHEMVTH
jgi:hypothetical protein